MANEQLMNHIVGRILHVCPTEMIVLFGSYARGDHDKSSDVDLVVVTSRKVARKSVERQIRSSIHRYGIKSDILIRTKSELEEEMAVKGGFLKSVFPGGKVLYKKTNFFLAELNDLYYFRNEDYLE